MGAAILEKMAASSGPIPVAHALWGSMAATPSNPRAQRRVQVGLRQQRHVDNTSARDTDKPRNCAVVLTGENINISWS